VESPSFSFRYRCREFVPFYFSEILSEQLNNFVVPRTVIDATGRSKISIPMVYSLCAQIGSQTDTHNFTGSLDDMSMAISTCIGAPLAVETFTEAGVSGH
jgi:hypothetical protein